MGRTTSLPWQVKPILSTKFFFRYKRRNKTGDGVRTEPANWDLCRKHPLKRRSVSVCLWYRDLRLVRSWSNSQKLHCHITTKYYKLHDWRLSLSGPLVEPDVDPLSVVVVAAVDDVVAVVAREMRSEVAAAVAADDVAVVVLVQLVDGDEDVVVIAAETSANISEPMLDETSPPAADDTGPNRTSQQT